MNEELAEAAGTRSRWPRVIGTIGIVIGVVMVVDGLDDLVFLPVLRSAGALARFVGADVANLVRRALPPQGWMVANALVGISLGAFLVFASARLRRRRRSGISLCRAWGWVALGVGAVEIAGAVLWLGRQAAEIGGLAARGWPGSAAFGLAVAAVVVFTYPVFLLVWLYRPAVQRESSSWVD